VHEKKSTTAMGSVSDYHMQEDDDDIDEDVLLAILDLD